MFRNPASSKTVLKIMGAILAFLALVLITRTILYPHMKHPAEAGETVEIAETVLDSHQVDIPEIDQTNCQAYSLEINEGKPFFTSAELTDAKEQGYYVYLMDLDPLGRAQAAIMCADESHIQTEERNNDLSEFEPSGWHRNAIYERSHLLMWKLCGMDALTNLITGTEYFNQVEMLQYEKKVTGYLWDHPENHVLYRVTPYYQDEELVSRGVLMEAWSLEDDGALSMCEFVYNAQPGSEVVYETGVYHMYESWQDALETSQAE